MALIACSECGKQISTNAASCPNCGCRVKRRSVQQAKAGCMVMVIALGILIIVSMIMGALE